MASDHLILTGGGHSHALLLRRWAIKPHKRPRGRITLVSNRSASLYSGMVPAHIAGIDQRHQLSINVRWLAQQAKKLAKDYDCIKTEVLDEKQMEKMGTASVPSDRKSSIK